MGVLDRMIERFGFTRIDKAPAEVETANEEEVETMGKLIELPTGRGKKVKIKDSLKFTVAQELAFMHPFRDGMKPPRECFDNERLASGFQLVKSLMIVPDETGTCLVWHALVAAFQPTLKGNIPIKPRGPLKGIMVTRAQGLLKCVGEVGNGDEGWKDKRKQYSMYRRLTHSEEAEFKRIHGEQWVADALANSAGSPLKWEDDGTDGQSPA